MWKSGGDEVADFVAVACNVVSSALVFECWGRGMQGPLPMAKVVFWLPEN
jgi:hypothetical protein